MMKIIDNPRTLPKAYNMSNTRNNAWLKYHENASSTTLSRVTKWLSSSKQKLTRQKSFKPIKIHRTPMALLTTSILQTLHITLHPKRLSSRKHPNPMKSSGNISMNLTMLGNYWLSKDMHLHLDSWSSLL